MTRRLEPGDSLERHDARSVSGGLSSEHIGQIIRGEVPVAGDTARRLERAAGVPEQLWNNLESRYQEREARLGG